MAEQGYRVPEVCSIVGITYRQLDYWARTGLVRPSVKDAKGSGSQRLYSFQDLALLRLIKRMLDSGVNLQQVRKAMKTLKGLDQPALGTTLVSDGHRIYSVESPEAVVDLLASGQGVFAIAVDKVWTELEGTLAKSAGKKARQRPRGRRRVTEGATAETRRRSRATRSGSRTPASASSRSSWTSTRSSGSTSHVVRSRVGPRRQRGPALHAGLLPAAVRPVHRDHDPQPASSSRGRTARSAACASSTRG